jgi:hypothetical protein
MAPAAEACRWEAARNLYLMPDAAPERLRETDCSPEISTYGNPYQVASIYLSEEFESYLLGNPKESIEAILGRSLGCDPILIGH